MVSAALSVVDQVGVEAVSIRAIAKLVGAPPMSLYAHFTSKEQLLDMMYAEVARRMYADLGETTWQAELLALCAQIRRVLREHPRWAPLIARPTPPATVPLRERLLGLMVADGMAPDEAMAALTSTMLTAHGLVLAELSILGPSGGSAFAERFARIRDWVGARADDAHPVTRTAFSKLIRLDFDANFELTTRALIAGLDARRSPR